MKIYNYFVILACCLPLFINEYNLSIGSNDIINKHITPSGPTVLAFTPSEYNNGDLPSGAYAPKNINPDITWHIYIINMAIPHPNNLLFLKYPATPKTKKGNG